MALLLVALSPTALYSALSPEVALHAGGTPAIAASETKALVVYRLGSEVDGIFAGRDARPLGAPFVIATDVVDTYPGVASDGTSFLVAWTSAGQVRSAFVRANGAVEPLPAIASGAALSDAERVSVAFDGARYFVFWKDEVARGAAISPAGVVEAILSFPDLTYIGGAAGDPSRLVVIGDANHDGVVGAYAATVDAALNVSPAQLIAGETFTAGFGSPFVTSPGIIPLDGGFLAVWVRGRTSRRNEVQATRLTADLHPLDVGPSAHPPLAGTSGREIHATGFSLGDQHYETRVARAGERAVVGWSLVTGGEEAGIWAAFLGDDGSPLQIVPVAIRGKFDPESLYYPRRLDLAGFTDGRAIVVFERSGRIAARLLTADPPPRRRVAAR